MIIGIDGGFLSSGDRQKEVGVYQVGINLLRWLNNLDKQNKYAIYVFRQIQITNFTLQNNFSLVNVQPSKFWNYFSLPLYLLRNKPDIFLGLSQSIPLICPGKKLLFIHDLAFQKFPKLYKDAKKLITQTKFSIKRADKIITVSNTSKRDLIELYKIEDSKIRLLYPGCDETFGTTTAEEITKVKKKYKISSPFFLFVGSLKKVKNIPFIIRGFDQYLSKTEDNIKLVICGGQVWHDEEISIEQRNMRFKDSIKQLGFVDRNDLPALYSGAEAFVSPSLYEGFGLTHIEAMACGCPVLASNVGSLPEVVGEAAILIDPLNVEQLVKALITLRNKAVRENLILLGKKQARKYNWENFSRGVIEEINNLCP